MNMNKIVLAVAIAATTSFANAGQVIEVNVGEVITEASKASSSALNLAINNVDKIDASISLTAPMITGLNIETTAIGAVQSGFIKLENALTRTTHDQSQVMSHAVNEFTNRTGDIVDNSYVNDIENLSASTSSTSALDIKDKSDVKNLDMDFSFVSHNIADATNTTNDILNGTNLNQEFGLLNVAYNNANIDASVIAATNLVGVGEIAGKIHTSAIGAVQSGNITVTVK